MKQMKNFVKRYKILMLIVASALLFSACKKDETTPIPTSGLMVFNLVPGPSSIGFVLNNKSITGQPLSFSNYSGNYISIFSGNRELGVYDVSGDSTLSSESMNFEPNNYYSAFALGTEGNVTTLIVDDHLDSIPDSTGHAFIRYINAIPDSSQPALTISASDSDIVNTASSYAEISSFKEVNPGDITITISNGTNISATRTITVEKGKVYTILLLGKPDATDDANKVQIKYITNGSVS